MSQFHAAVFLLHRGLCPCVLLPGQQNIQQGVACVELYPAWCAVKPQLMLIGDAGVQPIFPVLQKVLALQHGWLASLPSWGAG